MNPQTKVIELVHFRAGSTGRIEELTARRVGTVNRGTVVLRDPLGRDVLKMATAPFFVLSDERGTIRKESWHQTREAATKRAVSLSARRRGVAVIVPPPSTS